MYKSTGLRSQIWLSMYSASAMLVMLYAINSVMDSEWSDWVAWQCSVVTCLYHHWIKPLACQVVKLWSTRGFIFDNFRKICTRSFTRMQSRSFFVFVFVCFFIRFVKYLSPYILCHSISVCTHKSNKILSWWLNNIGRGRLVYQMSTAPESQKRNDKRSGA